MAKRGKIAEECPEVAAELVDQSLGWTLSAGSDKKVEFRCPKEHVYEMRVASRTRGDGCPYCSGRRAIRGETDLATTCPDIAAELVDQSLGWKLSAGSGKKVEFRCPKGHLYKMRVVDRTEGRGCPYCSGQKVLRGYNDLATTSPDIAAELVDKSLGWTLSAGSGKKAEFRCPQGHIYEKAVVDRTSNGRGCSYCFGRRVLRGYNDLATTCPDIAAELVDQSLRWTLSAGSEKKVEFRCPKGHVYEMKVKNRTGGYRCPYCAGQKVLRGYNDLATVRPDIAAQLVEKSLGWTLSAGSHKKVEFRCPKGHLYKMRVVDRTEGRGCPTCANETRSLVQNRIHERIQERYPLATNDGRTHIPFGKRKFMEIDIFIPEISVAVEYDGCYWHAGRAEKDISKSHAIIEHGYRLVRIRETPLPSLGIDNPNYTEIETAPVQYSDDAEVDRIVGLVLSAVEEQPRCCAEPTPERGWTSFALVALRQGTA